uniref:BTB domain-containing protein n=1 Tax=Panagrellus redivivus TaxID=6233 RepID=A0A7E4UQC6_PANRE
MASINDVDCIKDFNVFLFFETDIRKKGVGAPKLHPLRAIPDSDGIEWWLECYAGGRNEAAKGHFSVFVYVKKAVKLRVTISIDGSSVKKSATSEHPAQRIGWDHFASHDELLPLFQQGKLRLLVQVVFYVPIPVMPDVAPLHELCAHVPTDFEIVVGSDRLQVHRSVLSLMSPVFHAMLTSNTVEAKSNSVKIVDFDIKVVEAAIDICYGRDLKDHSVGTYLGILRFNDKYSITAVLTELEGCLPFNLSVDTFCAFVQYATDCSRDALFKKLVEFFAVNQSKITPLPQFINLPPTLVVHVLKSSFDLETDFDVLRHASKNGIKFIVNHLEKPLLESLTSETICPTIRYAWKCSRVALKKACAKFVSENRDEIMKTSGFLKLPAAAIGGVLKLAHGLSEKDEEEVSK